MNSKTIASIQKKPDNLGGAVAFNRFEPTFSNIEKI